MERLAGESKSGRETHAPAQCGGDPDFMASLAKGLRVLHALGVMGQRLTISEISRSTGITRAAARRCLYTLRELGYAAVEGRHYFLQPKVLTLGFAYLSTAPIPSAAQPVLEDLSGRLGEAASVGVLDEGAVVCLARAASRYNPTDRVGSRVPAYCTALGRVLLAGLPAAQASIELAKIELVARTPFTVTSPGRLGDILQQARSDSYALDDQELTVALRSIAVPVQNTAGKTVAALGISAQCGRVSRRELLERGLPLLRAASARLGRRLAAPG